MVGARVPGSGLTPPYRVLDFAYDEKGIFCTKLLADLGADVVKVEPPGGGADRRKPPFYNDEAHPEKSLYFLYYNTGKRSITLNIENRDGRALLLDLVKNADVLVETFPVGHLRGLGLGYEALKSVNQGLVMASITPFGQTGSHSAYKSSDLVAMAASGYAYITGDPDEPPVRPGNEQSHFPASLYAATAVLAALYHREFQSGQGQQIDVSMQEAIIPFYLDQHPAQTWLRTGQNPTRVGLSSSQAIPLGAFPCRDGWVGIGVASAEEWDTLAQWIHEVTGDEDILDDRLKGATHARLSFRDEVEARIANFTTGLPVAELVTEGQRKELVVIPVQSPQALLNDPHMEAGDFWIELDHPVVGALKYPRGAFEKGDVPAPRRAAPLLGEHNEEIYCGDLGLATEELGVLRGLGII